MTSAPAAGPTGRHHARRLDIQGMRGLAVIPGVTYHMTETVLPGAVIFIDMFFVISGFLITCRLIELAQSRDIHGYFRDFYRFRLKRLLPAALVALGVTTVLAHVIFVPSRAAHVTDDAVSSLLFFANIRYAAQGTDYMHRTEATSPLLPFWSLSMEEQFYLLWPILVFAVIFWAARGRRQRSTLAWVATAIAVLSFAYGLWFTGAHHVAAYYDTLSRMWDFSIGSLLAVYATRARLSHGAGPTSASGVHAVSAARWIRDRLNAHAGIVSWTGGLLFFVAIAVTPTDHGFPVPWGLLGVTSAALVIYAGIDQRIRNRLIDNRLIVWLGDISYSIYLVHFPIIIFAGAYLLGHKGWLYTFDTVAILGAAIVLHYFVEEPGRRGFTASRAWFTAGRHRPVVNAVMAIGALATVVFAIAPKSVTPVLAAAPASAVDTVATASPTTASTAAPPVTPIAPFDDPDLVPATPALDRDLRSALRVTTMPKVANAGRVDSLSAFLTPCNAVDPLAPPCIAKPAPGTDANRVAVAYGDSMMLAYWPMIRAAFTAQGWTVVLAAHVDCGAVVLSAEDDQNRGCRAFHAAYPRLLERWHPDLVLLTSGEKAFTGLQAMPGKPYAPGLRAAIGAATQRGARALVLSPPPSTADTSAPSACLIAGASPQSCVYTPGQSWYAMNRVDRSVAAAAGATYADLAPFFCHDLLCPGIVGDLVVHADGSHITPEYAERAAPSFRDYLLRRHLI